MLSHPKYNAKLYSSRFVILGSMLMLLCGLMLGIIIASLLTLTFIKPLLVAVSLPLVWVGLAFSRELDRRIDEAP